MGGVSEHLRVASSLGGRFQDSGGDWVPRPGDGGSVNLAGDERLTIGCVLVLGQAQLW